MDGGLGFPSSDDKKKRGHYAEKSKRKRKIYMESRQR